MRCACTAPTTPPGERSSLGIQARRQPRMHGVALSRQQRDRLSGCARCAAARLMLCSAPPLALPRNAPGLACTLSPRLAVAPTSARAVCHPYPPPTCATQASSNVPPRQSPRPLAAVAGTTRWTCAPCGCTPADTAAPRAPGALPPSCQNGRTPSGSRLAARLKSTGSQCLLCRREQCSPRGRTTCRNKHRRKAMESRNLMMASRR